MPDRLTWLQRFYSAHGEKYSYEKFVNAKGHTLVTIICPVHGDFQQSPYNHAKGHGCDKCAGTERGLNRRSSTEDFIKKAQRVWGDLYLYHNTRYIKSSGPIIVTCKIHGDFQVKANGHLNNRRGCHQCSLSKRGKYEGQQELSQRTAKARIEKARNSIIDRARAVHGDFYSYDLDSYTSAREPMTITCPDHGPFKMTVGHHISRGHRCPVCAKSVSSIEYQIRKLIEELSVSVEYRNRSILGGKEIDIYFPDRKLGIEINGLYWHRDEATKKWSLRKKWEEAKEKGIRLIHLFEDECRNKPEIVLDLIKASLGLRPTLMARHTQVVQLSVEEARAFLDKWHIQGYGNSSLRYGLKLGDQLVSVLTLGKPRFSNEDWEIIRLASSHHIPGGFSKMFKAFLKEHQPQSVMTFADLRLGSGNTYSDSGFKLEHITSPDYWWVKGQKDRIPRYQTQKKKLATHPIFAPYYKDELSENQICQVAKYFKVSGVGHAKFIWGQA